MSAHLGFALRRLAGRPGATLVTASLVAAVLLVAAVAATLLLQVQGLLRSTQREAGLLAYLADDAPAGRLHELARELEHFPGIAEVRALPREAALADLRDSLGPDEDLLRGLGAGFLPDVVEIVPGRAAEQPGGLDALSEQIASLPGVAAVERAGRGRESVLRLGALVQLLRVGGGGLLVLMLLLAAWIVGGVVSLRFLARAEEVRLMRLLGATEGFLRAPFVWEGVIIGALGGGVALAGELGVIGALRAALGPDAALLGLQIQAPPLWLLVSIVAVATALGGLGAALGAGRSLQQ